MSIEQRSVVDAIGRDEVSGAVHLTIADHLPWNDEHLIKLQDKLNTYLAFMESGEVYQAYPGAAGSQLEINAIFKYRPTVQASAFLEHASRAVTAAGFIFKYGPLEGGYVDDHA
jgi:hypothetical protein